MAEVHLPPTIRAAYVAQENPLLCWAAVGLTLWRARFGMDGRGASLDTLMAAEGGAPFADMLDFARRICAAAEPPLTPRTLRTALDALRAAEPRWEAIPEGLPVEIADNFFAGFLKTHTVPLDATLDAVAIKALIRRHAPVAVFSRRDTHLAVIVGYLDHGPADVRSPHLLVFDPEATPLRERRMPWDEWHGFFVHTLVGKRGWHY